MPDVSIAACKDYEESSVRAALGEALAPFGGLGWVRPGMRIAVKVNLVGAHKPEEAATTHPAPLRALCAMLVEKGASVVIGDSPGGLFTAAYLAPIYRASGMHSALMEGVQLNDDFSELDVDFPEGHTAKQYRMTKYLLDADAVIDFCKPKTHGMMVYTGACKNFYGAVPGLLKGEYHYRYAEHTRFANLLVDLAECVKPRLCLADFVYGMEGNGPSKGKPRFVGCLAASESPHKMDMLLSHIMGMAPDEVPTLTAAIERGLTPPSPDALDVAGDYRPFVGAPFERAAHKDLTGWAGSSPLLNALAQKLLASRPRVEAPACIGCGKCAAVCPAKAIAMEAGGPKGKLPRIERKTCIRCFCCQEFCPVGAMRVHRPVMARLLSK